MAGHSVAVEAVVAEAGRRKPWVRTDSERRERWWGVRALPVVWVGLAAPTPWRGAHTASSGYSVVGQAAVAGTRYAGGKGVAAEAGADTGGRRRGFKLRGRTGGGAAAQVCGGQAGAVRKWGGRQNAPCHDKDDLKGPKPT